MKMGAGDKKTRNLRRKDERPQEIIDAALEAFSLNGFAATRLDDVAERAGISKGTIYLYFKCKEELFKAAVKNRIFPILEIAEDLIAEHHGSAEALIRKIMTKISRRLVEEKLGLLQLIIAEGNRFPELAAFYHEQVMKRVSESTRTIIKHGIETGEFRDSAITEYPHILQAPLILSLLCMQVFDDFRVKSIEELVETQLDLIFQGLRA